MLQLKEKKKQVFLKTTAEGRQRARQKRAEEELQREKQNQLEEEKRLYVATFHFLISHTISRGSFPFYLENDGE